MPVFTYKALQAYGRTVEGELEAGGRQEAMRLVGERQLRPIRLTEHSLGQAGNGGAPAAPKLSPKGWEATKDSPKDAKHAGAPASGLNLSLGSSNKITPRILENF